jgi:hypothetical protein
MRCLSSSSEARQIEKNRYNRNGLATACNVAVFEVPRHGSIAGGEWNAVA